MRIALDDLEPGQVIRTAFHEVVDSGGEPAFDAPVTGTIEVARSDRTLRLRGTVETTAALTCGRCLKPYGHRLRATLDEEFLEEDFAAATTADQVLDVSDTIRQHLLLAAPMVPRCTETCRGLCSQCGANWNEAACSCRTDAVDPRLAPLQQLKESLPEE